MTYRPRPGSAGDRALEQLGLVAGPMSQRDLADAVDVDPKNLQSNIVMCLRAGLIRREVIGGLPMYSVGDGVPSEVAEIEPEKPLVAADAPAPAEPGAQSRAAQAAERETFKFGVHRDGRLLIDLGVVFVTLSAAQTNALDRYLARRRAHRAA